MNELKAPSLQSLLESDKGSTDSLLAESLQLDIEDLDDAEYSIPPLDSLPTLESVLNDLEGESDNGSEIRFTAPTPTPSIDDVSRSGSILRHILLQGVTSQVSSAADRVNAGLATALAVGEFISAGTSHGHILNFDNSQTLRWAHQDENAQGAVSALAYNDDSTRLLAGFARGLVIMIDTASGDILRTLPDVITPNSGVLNIRWTDRPALALCSDTGGSVWSLSFTRKLGIRGCASRCLFSGARGEVCTIEPLILEEDHNGLKSNCIVALGTLSKYFVITIKPRLKVVKFHLLNGPPGCLPLLAWQMVLIQAADTSRTIDPVLAVSRGNHLYFHQITMQNNRVNLLFLRHIQMDYSLLALHWLGPKSLACVDTSEMLHLMDVRTSKEMECIDLGKAGLVYSSAQFKGLATGGNVSPALALAGTYACYNSIVSRGIQLYVLGARSLHMVNIRSWHERVTYLVNNQRWAEACELAIEGYRAAGDRQRRKQHAKERIVELFHEYVSSAHRTPEFCLGPIIKCLIEINEVELLWQELWDKLNTPNLFLTIITEYIENDEIKIVSPVVAQALVDFWSDISPEKLEDIILKLNWECLDLHQVLTATKKKKLFKSQMYLNSQALGDYTISLTEFIPIICEEDSNLGNCLLVYISSCLAGRGYPTGEISEENVPKVKHEVLRCLTSIHSNKSDENEKPYPYLRALLNFDTRETLNVLSLAFQEKEFSGELGLSHRQRIINILLEILTPDNTSWVQIGCLLHFVSLQIIMKCLPEEPTLLERVLSYLQLSEIQDESPRQHAEREQTWLELIAADCFKHIPLDEHLRMAEKAKCFRVVEYFLEQEGKYDKIVECQLNDRIRNNETLSYIENYAKIPCRQIYSQVAKHLLILFKIDGDWMTKIIVDNFLDKIEEFVSIFQADAHQLYLFLKNLIGYGVTLKPEHCEIYIELLCQENPKNVKDFLMTNASFKLENALEIVTKYQLLNCCVLLYEKQGDYQLAFKISLDLLREAPESTAEESALKVSALCSRASEVLSEKQREEFWFPLLNIILSRSDLSSITRSILHVASQHVDLSKLVQLVLNSGTQTGSFGDIKHLLVSMLSNSRYETLLLETTDRILSHDLHNKFAQKRKLANRGLWITIIKCVVCRQRLYNQMNVIVLGTCGHCMHEDCIKNVFGENYSSCPRCGVSISTSEPAKLAEPSHKLIENDVTSTTATGMLNLRAPPRKL